MQNRGNVKTQNQGNVETQNQGNKETQDIASLQPLYINPILIPDELTHRLFSIYYIIPAKLDPLQKERFFVFSKYP
jgi:hypothetical protein